MKKSHRKDVIIARIIFAAICAVLIAIIVLVAVMLHNRNEGKKEQENSQMTESMNLPPETQNPLLPPVTENPETEEETVFVWTRTGVNMREEPNTEGALITVLEPASKLELLGEEEGWVKVQYNGTEGYVCSDYITGDDPGEAE